MEGPECVALGELMLLEARRGVLGVKRLIEILVVPVVQAGKVEIRMKSCALSELSRG
jgi:hypothetical protein